jgi:hypothetical protein
VVDGHGDQAVTPYYSILWSPRERASQYKARVGTTLFESCPSSSTVALEYCGLKRGANLKKANAHTTVVVLRSGLKSISQNSIFIVNRNPTGIDVDARHSHICSEVTAFKLRGDIAVDIEGDLLLL